MRKIMSDIQRKNKPELDPHYLPFETIIRAFESEASETFQIEIVRDRGLRSVYETKIFGTTDSIEKDCRYIERIVKFLLWQKGGYRITLCGSEAVCQAVAHHYQSDGSRGFDVDFMETVYENPFSIENKMTGTLDLAAKDSPLRLGKNQKGCRIGFDAGGSDRKASAVIDGAPVFSEEILWHPKEVTDPAYHEEEILAAFRETAKHMPHVDAIGVSTAGVVIDNKLKVSSLFVRVPADVFREKAQDIYIRTAEKIGDIPLYVANDGDVTALAGAMDLKVSNLLGIAMGTSEAVGYINKNGDITGWLNELAFAPVDFSESAALDSWSRDVGVGSQYFSQDAVIRLATTAGIDLSGEESLSGKLCIVQDLAEKDMESANAVFNSIGCYLGHTIPLYYRFYGMEHILLLGRVMSGKGGDLILDTATRVLKEEYPEIAAKVAIHLPDSDESRRVGQSIAAASLPHLWTR